MNLHTLITEAVERGASDLHLVVGIPPSLRINGEIELTGHEKLFPGDTKGMIYGILNEVQEKRFENERELNLSFSIPNLTRVRMNVYMEKGYIEAALRIIPFRVSSLVELGLPKVVADLTKKPNGLVLITGPAGMGKTTTLASMVDFINRDSKRKYRIITIEDPIEYIHQHLTSTIIQREVETDTHSFSEALRQALRQDPNLICVGEMRDLETISIALTAAETGHLVFATLHTASAVQTINRIIDVFPPSQHGQIRSQLSSCLQGIISQRLLQRAESQTRILAYEILISNSAVRNIITSGVGDSLETVISTSSHSGMISLDKSLMELFTKGLITYETALAHAKYPKTFMSLKQR